MEKSIQKLENESDVINFIDRIDYGSIYFIAKNVDVISFIDNCMKVINASLGAQVVRYEPEQLVDMLQMYGMTFGDGLYKIISTRSKDQIPELSDDSYNIAKFLNDAFNNKRLVRLDIDQSLYPYAKRLAKKDVLFDVDSTGPFFWGVNKEKSVYDQIKQAFYNGEDSIKFDVKTVSVATVRCYTSTLSKMSGNKFRCNIIDGFVTVQFKPISDEQDAVNRIIPVLSIFKSNDEKFNFLMRIAAEFKDNDDIVVFPPKTSTIETNNITANVPEIPAFIPKLYGKEVSLDEYKNAENWQRIGFASKYNWENDIKGDIDMYPKDARFDDSDDDEDQEPAKYNWDDDEEKDDF